MSSLVGAHSPTTRSGDNGVPSPLSPHGALVGSREVKMSSSFHARPSSFILQPRKPPKRETSQEYDHQGSGVPIGRHNEQAATLPMQRSISTVTPPEENSPLLNKKSSQDYVSLFISPCKSYPPTPTLTQFTSPSVTDDKNCRGSPIKKQRTRDRFRIQHSSPDTSFSENSLDESSDENYLSVNSYMNCEGTPSRTPKASVPSSPFLDLSVSAGQHPFPSNQSKDFSSISPFTPQCRGMLQKLNISSPPPANAASPVPDITLSTVEFEKQIPIEPSCSFSPNINPENSDRKIAANNTATNDDIKVDTIESSGWGGFGAPSSNNSVVDGTPSRSSVTTSTNSPFQPCIPPSKRMHMRHHSGSSFKALPPRLHSQANGNLNETLSSSSSYSASPSPRVVPLTVLARNGSPVMSPMVIGSNPFASAATQVPVLSGRNNGNATSMSSPLMRSLDRDKEIEDAEYRHYEEEQNMMNNEVVTKFGPPKLNLMVSSNKYHPSPALPKIKLTPRAQQKQVGGIDSKKTFLSMDSPSWDDALDDFSDILKVSKRTHSGDVFGSLILAPKSSCSPSRESKSGVDIIHSDDVDFVSGFERHNASIRTKSHRSDDDDLEGDDAEMVELANNSKMPPTLWLPPSHRDFPKTSTARLSDFSCVDEDASFSSTENGRHLRKSGMPPRVPMPSITLRCSDQPGIKSSSTPSKGSGATSGTGLLPRSHPVPQCKSRSLFRTSSAEDPIDRILRADAIAEAARSNEPLTDDDSDAGSGFFLSSPQFSSLNETRPKHVGKSIYSPMGHEFGFKNETRPEGSDSFLEASPAASLVSRRRGLKVKPSSNESSISAGCSFPTTQSSSLRDIPDATFSTSLCSLSDCDSSDLLLASPRCSRKKSVSMQQNNDSDSDIYHCQLRERASVCSILSMSSLHGLDIVHESSDQLNCKVSSTSDFLKSDYTYNASQMMNMRSELSLNSLGLSVDSQAEFGAEGRDLCTPTPTSARHNKYALSPPPLQTRSSHLIERS